MVKQKQNDFPDTIYVYVGDRQDNDDPLLYIAIDHEDVYNEAFDGDNRICIYKKYKVGTIKATIELDNDKKSKK